MASLSLHSAWPASDLFLRTVVGGWRIMAEALGSVTDMAIAGIFPWCLTPELYAARPEYIESLANFVRSRPMPPVDAFLRQSQAVLDHDAQEVLGSVLAPTLITFGRHDQVTSTRFSTSSPRGSAAAPRSPCSRTARPSGKASQAAPSPASPAWDALPAKVAVFDHVFENGQPHEFHAMNLARDRLRYAPVLSPTGALSVVDTESYFNHLEQVK